MRARRVLWEGLGKGVRRRNDIIIIFKNQRNFFKKQECYSQQKLEGYSEVLLDPSFASYP